MIKVRVWHKKIGEYVQASKYLVIDHSGALDNDDCVIEKFTGLKDKDGVEIYEGDIFIAPHDFGPEGYHYRKGVASFDEYSGYQWQYWDIENIQVIGNIHESPELMEPL